MYHSPPTFLFSLALQPSWVLASAFQFHDHFTDCRTPWTSDQLVARPLPKHRTTQTQNKHVHTTNIHALCGIRNHDPSVRASEDSSCLRPLGYSDRTPPTYHTKTLSLLLITNLDSNLISRMLLSCSHGIMNGDLELRGSNYRTEESWQTNTACPTCGKTLLYTLNQQLQQL
jgi:hypothetical protein